MLQTTLIDKEISINDKECFDKYFETSHVLASEMNFTNFFMWKDHYKIRFGIIYDFLCIMSVRDEPKPFCFFPVGDYKKGEDLKKTVYAIKDYFDQEGWNLIFSRVTKQQKEILDEIGIAYNAIEDRDNADYVYTVKSLSTLAGKKLDGKRNHINKFKKLYSYEYEEITPANIQECKNIVEKWYQLREQSGDESLSNERIANNKLLDNYEILGLKGGLIRVNGKTEAFTVGEQLNKNTAVIHVEKANAEIHGIYTVINQQFINNEWLHLEYVNREQDMGIAGLRKAKLSYNPDHLIEKYTIEVC